MKRVLVATLILAGSLAWGSSERDCESRLTVPYAKVVKRALDQHQVTLEQIAALTRGQAPFDVLESETRTSTNAGLKSYFQAMASDAKVRSDWPEIVKELAQLLSARGADTEVVAEAKDATHEIMIHEKVATLHWGAGNIRDWTVDKDGRILILRFAKNDETIFVEDIAKSGPIAAWKVGRRDYKPTFSRDAFGDVVVREGLPGETSGLDRWLHFRKKQIAVQTFNLRDQSSSVKKFFLDEQYSLRELVPSKYNVDIAAYDHGAIVALTKKPVVYGKAFGAWHMQDYFSGNSGWPIIMMGQGSTYARKFNFIQFDGQKWQTLNSSPVQFGDGERSRIAVKQLKNGDLATAWNDYRASGSNPGFVFYRPRQGADEIMLPATGSMLTRNEIFQAGDGRVFVAAISFNNRSMWVDVFEPGKNDNRPILSYDLGYSHWEGTSINFFERKGHIYFAGYSSNKFELFADFKSAPIYEKAFERRLTFSTVVKDGAENVYLVEQGDELATYSLFTKVPGALR